MTQPALSWRKSTRSGSQSDCVEVASTLDRLRDSKNPGPVLKVDRAALSSFLAAAHSGTFDRVITEQS